MTSAAISSKLIKQSFQLLLLILLIAAVFSYFILISTHSLAGSPFYNSESIVKNTQDAKQTISAKGETISAGIIIKTQKSIPPVIDKQTIAAVFEKNTTKFKNKLVQATRTNVATANIENYDTSSSIELVPIKSQQSNHIWDFSADIRAVYSGYEKQLNNGELTKETDLLIRIRGDAIATISDNLRASFGIAGTCALSNCDADFTLQADLPGSSGLNKGQITIDEMYLHWLSDEPHRFKLAIGRMQTRSVLKTGVFNKSLDRINSNNARINWTDGVHATYQFDNGWTSNFIMQYNNKEGSGSVYHDAIDFSDSDAQQSYFTSFENNQIISGVTQRSIGFSYLPSVLLSSQEIIQGAEQEVIHKHDDYVGVVGKIAWLWPKKNSGYTLRGGFELGYSPTQPSYDVVGIKEEETVSGLAWNAVFNIMDIYPGQNFGINYAHTGAGWQLSPQYKPNTKLLEFRYQWQLNTETLFEARLRWQDELEDSKVVQESPFQDNQADFYVRLTRNF